MSKWGRFFQRSGPITTLKAFCPCGAFPHPILIKSLLFHFPEAWAPSPFDPK